MILAWFIRRLIGMGLSQARASALAPFAAALALFALCGALAGLWLHFHDQSVIAAEEAKTAVKIAPAVNAAADERAKDAIANAKQEEQAHDAIKRSGPDTVPAPAAVAHNCERLRRARVEPPASCRH